MEWNRFKWNLPKQLNTITPNRLKFRLSDAFYFSDFFLSLFIYFFLFNHLGQYFSSENSIAIWSNGWSVLLSVKLIKKGRWSPTTNKWKLFRGCAMWNKRQHNQKQQQRQRQQQQRKQSEWAARRKEKESSLQKIRRYWRERIENKPINCRKNYELRGCRNTKFRAERDSKCDYAQHTHTFVHGTEKIRNR